jgi:hypothetical protein
MMGLGATSMGSGLEDEWIAELSRRRWTHFYFPNREQPRALAGVFWHTPNLVDVVQIFPDADAFAYRAPIPPNGDPFKPTAVVWTYGGGVIWTIRAVLALPGPGEIDAPTQLMPPPPMCRVLPELAGRTRGFVIRPPLVCPPQGHVRGEAKTDHLA